LTEGAGLFNVAWSDPENPEATGIALANSGYNAGSNKTC